ncbi:hypothetical protein BDK51DRAFT_24261, partial [Blyttiomyces helicus]
QDIAKQMRVGRQEDAHEFIRYFIEALQKSSIHGFEKLDNRIKETSVIHQIFGGYLLSQVKCHRCNYNSNTYDPILDFSLEIKNCDTIEKAFAQFTKPELLTKDNRYKCEKCNALVDARKRITVHEAPAVLTVQLKRFDFLRYGRKVNKPVGFRETLDITPYMSPNQGRAVYKLYGVLVHAGHSCNSWHYFSFVKNSNDAWFSMNDTEVRQVGLNTVLKQTAYILFYRRADEAPAPSKPPVSKVRKTGICDSRF